MRRLRESDVVNAVLQVCSYTPGVNVWRMNSGMAKYTRKDGKMRCVLFGFPGAPDIEGIIGDGYYIGIECKRSRKKPEVEQIATLRRLIRLNVFVAYVEALDQIESFAAWLRASHSNDSTRIPLFARYYPKSLLADLDRWSKGEQRERKSGVAQLMGYPDGWLDLPDETPSTLWETRSRRKLSK